MKKQIVIIAIMLLNVFVTYSQKTHNVELYITPRNVTYGWYDNGIFQFKQNKKSIRVPYSSRTYMMTTVIDSVYELFYTKVKMPDSLCKNLTASNEYRTDKKRIMIIIPHSDTLFVDRNYNVILKEKSYKISAELKEFLEQYMPIGIKENWVNDLPGR